MKFNTTADAAEFVEVYLSHHGETGEGTNPEMVKNLITVGIPCAVYDGSDIAALQGDNLYRLDDYLYNTLAEDAADIEQGAKELLGMRKMGLYSHISDLQETAKEISDEYASEIYQRFLELDERA